MVKRRRSRFHAFNDLRVFCSDRRGDLLEGMIYMASPLRAKGAERIDWRGEPNSQEPSAYTRRIAV